MSVFVYFYTCLDIKIAKKPFGMRFPDSSYLSVMNNLFSDVSNIYGHFCTQYNRTTPSCRIPLLSEAHFWREQSQKVLKDALNRKFNTNVAKNVILFIGDGLGTSTVTAARILRGQLQGKPGEETVLEFEKFPHVALAKVK